MKEFKNGTRVGVVGRMPGPEDVIFLGNGVFNGMEMPPKEFPSDTPVGKITLDSGGTVWGHEVAFYGAEEEVKNFLAGSKVKTMSLVEFRAMPKPAMKKNQRRISVDQFGHELGIKVAGELLQFWKMMIEQGGDSNVASAALYSAMATCFGMVYSELLVPQDTTPEEFNTVFNAHRNLFFDFIAGLAAEETPETPLTPDKAPEQKLIIDG